VSLVLSELTAGWTSRIFDLSAKDYRSGLEVVSAIQAFLDARMAALPTSAKRAREERLESQDDYGSFGFELDPATVAQLGGEGQPVVTEDSKLATVSSGRDSLTLDTRRDCIAPDLSLAVGHPRH
jgi:hypothetical protein